MNGRAFRAALLSALVLYGCGTTEKVEPTVDETEETSTETEATPTETTQPTPEPTLDVDAGEPVTTPDPDAGTPTPTPDAGPAAEPDAGTGIVFGTPGPWPVENKLFDASSGILESRIVGLTTDESQNIWVATRTALYVMRPGTMTFKRFTATDGLHLMGNPVMYNDVSFMCSYPVTPECRAAYQAVPGEAASPGILEIEGGGPDEVFIGYQGIDEGSGDKADPNKHSGKIDRVKLNPDGTIKVDRFDLVSNLHGMEYWHNRTIYRLLYDHHIHKHELYAGTNHGVTLLYPDKYKAPVGEQYPDTVYKEWMGDHLHARVCYHMTCPDGSEVGQRMGEWRGLAFTADGDLWTAGRWTAGAVRWTSDIQDWYFTPRNDGQNAFKYAFGDPYPNGTDANGFQNEPVFKVPQEGDAVSLSAVAVAKDGRVWFSSGPWYGTGVDATEYGIASFDGSKFTVYDPIAQLGAPEKNVRDMVALPDGRLAIGFKSSGVLLWHPDTGSKAWIKAGNGIADDNVSRLELDDMVNPPALHITTQSGAARLRVLPQ